MAFIDENNNLVIDQGYEYDILGLVPGSTITVSIASSNDSGPEAYIYDTDTVLLGVGDSTTFEVAGTSIRVTANAGEGIVVVLSVTYDGEETPSLYSYPSIVPAAVSSELDESGEERIHIAPYDDAVEVGPVPPAAAVLQFYGPDGDGGGQGYIRIPMLTLESFNKGVCLNTSYDLVNNAESVVIIGYTPTNPEAGYSCGSSVPTEFETVNIPMVYHYNSLDGYYEWYHQFGSGEEAPTNGEYYIKLLVDGETEVVGIVYRGSGT